MQQHRQAGFTQIELLVVIAVIALLAALLFPVFARVSGKARQITCLSNLRQIGAATLMYAQDWDETLPPEPPGSDGMVHHFGAPGSPANYLTSILPYTRSRDILYCPNSIEQPPGFHKSGFSTPLSSASYCANRVMVGRSLNAVPSAAAVVYLHENWFRLNTTFSQPTGPTPHRTHKFWVFMAPVPPYLHLHDGRVNLLFMDGHVRRTWIRALRSSEFGLLPDEPYSDQRVLGEYYQAAF